MTEPISAPEGGPAADTPPLPAESDEPEYVSHHNGELPDSHTMSVLQAAHKAVAQFPDLVKRHQKYVGTAAVLSSAVVVLASIAISRRLHKGQTLERILDEITPEEIESMAAQKTVNPKKPRRGITRFLR